MTREEKEEELGNITKGQEDKLDDLSEKIDFLTETLTRVLKEKK
jgi:hypothetical protein